MNNCAYWPEGKPLDLFATTKRMVECMCICVCACTCVYVCVHVHACMCLSQVSSSLALHMIYFMPQGLSAEPGACNCTD